MYSGSIWSDIVMNDEEQEEKKSDNIKYELRFFDECIALLLVSRKNTSGEARTEKDWIPAQMLSVFIDYLALIKLNLNKDGLW